MTLVLASKSCNFGSIQGGDAAGNGINAFELEVDVVDAKFVVIPSYLLVDELLGYPGAALKLSLDWKVSEQ